MRKVKDLVSDVVIGMSDGLTVPFALSAGLSGATHSTHLVVTGSIAEISAGCISMGLGGYLASRAESEFDGTSETSDSKQNAIISSFTIGLSYVVGGIVPLIPYLVTGDAITAQLLSVICTLIALFIFGVVKGYYTKQNMFKSGLQTLFVGGLASGVAYFFARMANGFGG